jgi:alpha-aminoadipic semialdehyde synthase
VILAIDNLPCQLPVESSAHFGDTLLHFVPPLARCDWTLPLERLDLPAELQAAVVAHRGALAPRFAHLAQHLSPGPP